MISDLVLDHLSRIPSSFKTLRILQVFQDFMISVMTDEWS